MLYVAIPTNKKSTILLQVKYKIRKQCTIILCHVTSKYMKRQGERMIKVKKISFFNIFNINNRVP